MIWQSERALERAQQQLDEQLERGDLTNAEYTREVNELAREYREVAREAAEDAYYNELERW